MREIYWGDSLVRQNDESALGGLIERDGEIFFHINHYDRMPPFFMSITSGLDHWMFLSSTGGLTCGRKSPDNALFPYYTDDKIHDSCTNTGPQTIFQVQKNGRIQLWTPFSCEHAVYELERSLFKNLPGNRVIFEETNKSLGLVFSYSWSSSDQFGFVRKSSIRNISTDHVELEVLDGLRNLLPSGIRQSQQSNLSTLVDAYKQAEAVPGLTAAIYSLSSIPSDRAEPCEALRASVAWSLGLDQPQILLSDEQVSAFASGSTLRSETFKCGVRGSFFVRSSLGIPGSGQKTWYLVVDINQRASQLTALFDLLGSGLTAEMVEQDIAAAQLHLLQRVGKSDGCQLSADPLVSGRHFANTLFNIMRGGVFDDGYFFHQDDFLDFAATWNKPLRGRFEAIFANHPEPLSREALLAVLEQEGDADLQRLAMEYLPLMFSRRHGDPSRPWNHFSIDLQNDDGSNKLSFQGNWRDIFQNWEALAISYPEYIESFIAKFVNASTADGFNPYRISKDGFDWEVLDREDAWSNIGYWGDHQVNYLLRLLELSQRYFPGKISELFSLDLFVYANVPYRLKGYAAMRTDPRNSVEYDDELARDIAARVAGLGSDGKLVVLADGSVHRVNLLEKLLVPILSKLSNFVPGGGIWMNTQRPEWNDANNALVGYGLSMGTLCYLRRYLVLFSHLLELAGAEDFAVSAELLRFFNGVGSVLENRRLILDGPVENPQRKRFVDELGELGEQYRESIYKGFSGERQSLARSGLLKFVDTSLRYLDHSIAQSRREDGLFHSYNLIQFGETECSVQPLQEMLEGQVAVLSSGYLDAEQSLDLLGALRRSDLYRSDQQSYILYPNKKLPLFLQKNVLGQSIVENNTWIQRELASGCRDIVEKGPDGAVHFNSRFRNTGDLRSELTENSRLSAADLEAVCDVFETVFGHRQFTGRSGSMYKYEGLGCIYWHMVSKLLLATGELIVSAHEEGADESIIAGLSSCFDEIKFGLGLHKSPREYGAFPTDPYSHTPGFAGVQQPGMTGQVKEDVITRFSELGVKVRDGEITFEPITLRRGEFIHAAQTWRYSLGGQELSMDLPPGSLAFTLCGVPIIYRLSKSPEISIIPVSGDPVLVSGMNLGKHWSRSLFRRDQKVLSISVSIPAGQLRD